MFENSNSCKSAILVQNGRAINAILYLICNSGSAFQTKNCGHIFSSGPNHQWWDWVDFQFTAEEKKKNSGISLVLCMNQEWYVDES